MVSAFLSFALLFGSAFVGALPSLQGSQRRALTQVNLRIEGLTSTIYEGPVFTSAHNVTTPSGGNHKCNGLNGGANPTPGPTATTSLSDAAASSGFSFDGTFDSTFDDFFITSIGGVKETATQFWGLLLNYQFTPVGGCQQEVKGNDEVLWAFDAFNVAHFLKASAPNTAQKNHPVVITVVDGSTGAPIQGATVDGVTTDASGHASVTFTSAGKKTFKATLPGSLRSNAVTILVI